jgi:nifR3 family TIM-barrel protein
MKPAAPVPNFYIRDLPVFGDLILSPMDGYSDLPFRTICRELGSAMSYSEFVNVLDVLDGHPELARRLSYEQAERPVVFQIFDSEPDRILQAALKLQELEPDVIDINLGCSDRRVSSRGAGAGMLRTPLRIARTFRRLSRALDVPVTGKIRLGWDDNCRNYRLVARIIEENGGALVAVHGRTKQQSYGGHADWDAIAEIRQALSIPVIGNGDVRTPADIERMKAHTGVPAVMIGRGAIGNPWIFSRRHREDVSPEEARTVLLRHLERSLAFYGHERGLVLFRKHASRYISPYRLPDALRKRLLTRKTTAEFAALIDEVLASSGETIRATALTG